MQQQHQQPTYCSLTTLVFQRAFKLIASDIYTSLRVFSPRQILLLFVRWNPFKFEKEISRVSLALSIFSVRRLPQRHRSVCERRFFLFKQKNCLVSLSLFICVQIPLCCSSRGRIGVIRQVAFFWLEWMAVRWPHCCHPEKNRATKTHKMFMSVSQRC